jgi:hypothetical protein
MRTTITEANLAYAEKRPITTNKDRFQWVSQTFSLLGQKGFYEESLFSCGLEAQTREQLNMPLKPVDDCGPDYENAEVTSRAAHYWKDGRPYLCSRLVSKNPHTIRFFPTLTGFRVPTRDYVMDLRYFIEPEIMTLDDGRVVVAMNGRPLFLRAAYTRASGITRWQVDLVAAMEAGADIDVWRRFERVVRAPDEQRQMYKQWVEISNHCRKRNLVCPPMPAPLVVEAIMIVPPKTIEIASDDLTPVLALTA